ncbi:hypothetical protein IX39_13010 [Chryseobacterium formosense]|uniref:Uncharacterized protein n=1 Tax=Chryseobacterium formosense TaxID=236814 RepID=A0A085Z1P6_9FLAO|nr:MULTISPECIES: hypothetical protein [Chryseobacterium]KFE98359.1 hypothetical protein IX39_13010 [Chryseobacterium formosense]OCK52823.1 hypothetical protein BA768_10645 [Chryseobacterium sp. CBo1]SFT86822.1 hypothetical protein SAMN05421857_3796 [Chryseobacterium formosense]
MKNFLLIIKILRWIFGVLFLFISLGLLIEQSFTASIVMIVLTTFLIPLTGDFIFQKIIKIDFDGTNKILQTINYSDLDNILPIYQQNIQNHKKTISDKQKIKLGRKIYYNTLCTSISDFILNDNEISKLNDIKIYFNLSDQQIFLEKNRISERTVKGLIDKCYADQTLTDSENQQITYISTFLQFPLDQTEIIKNKIAFSIFNKILEEKISDNRLSPVKETELKQITRNLKIDNQNIKNFISERKIKNLQHAKLLWNLDHGIFPVVYNPPINLSKGEQCYLNIHANLVENKIVHRGYSTTSTGVSFRVMKGVNARVGGGRSRPIKENVTQIHPGTLFLTNLRIVFNAGGKSFQIPFLKLISHDIRGGSIEFIVQNKSYFLRLNLNEAEIMSLGLLSSIRQYRDSYDSLKIQAMNEKSMNEVFI